VFCNVNIASFYALNFQLMHIYKYSLTELDNMIPWERKIFLSLLNSHIQDENLKIQQKLANKGYN
jgi:hypothetical protein